MKINNMKGIVLMILAAISLSIMSGLIKSAKDIDSFKTTLFRFVVGVSILGIVAMFGKIELKFKHSPLLLLRGFLGGAGIFCLFLGIKELGVGKGTVLFYSYPIFATIFSTIFLKEKLSIRKIIAIFFAFIGIYLLASKSATEWSIGIYEILVLIGAILSGGAVVTVKKLHETDSTYAILFAQCIIGIWIVILPANLVPCSIGYVGGFLLLGIGVFATLGQLLLTEGYKYLPVATGALLLMLAPVLSFIIGIVIFSEQISGTSVTGAMLIICSCIAVIIKGNKKEK